jgi:hypothetical protein
MTNLQIEPSSFRDPSGFVFYRNNKILRQINVSYRTDYDLLMKSGLYKNLTDSGLLIPHSTSSEAPYKSESCSLVIEPEKIPYISYPYEWCFSELKDAALLTLKIQQTALQYGMSLKDASAYNIQFLNGKPVFIDTLSFEKYKEGSPWIAYGQFCRHFLAPLVLMKYKDVRLNQLLKVYIDGIPLDLASKILPLQSKFNFSVFSHIIAHAKSQKHFGNRQIQGKKYSISKFQLTAIIDGLQSFISKLKWKPEGFEWGDYYKDTNYSHESTRHKQEIITQFLSQTPVGMVYDIGGNIGTYSRLASTLGRQTICFDIDPAAVEKNYLDIKKSNEKNLLALVMDITNPSPGIGWLNQERNSFGQRGKAETVMALALVHHLAISNNLPLQKIAEAFGSICKYCIIEWIPKEDSQVKRLLATREDIFPDYTKEHFENCFKQEFEITGHIQINKSLRHLYLMKAISRDVDIV